MSIPLYNDTNWEAAYTPTGSPLVWTSGGWYYDGEYGGCSSCLRILNAIGSPYTVIEGDQLETAMYFPTEAAPNEYSATDFVVQLTTTTGFWYYQGVLSESARASGLNSLILPMPFTPVGETIYGVGGDMFDSCTCYVDGTPGGNIVRIGWFLGNSPTNSSSDRAYYIGAGISPVMDFWTGFSKTAEQTE